MRTSDFDYELPPELIAREPARPRDSSRMMLLDRKTGHWTDSHFRNLPEFLDPSDVLVINDTRVIRARIHGRLERASGTSRNIEVLFAAPVGGVYKAVNKLGGSPSPSGKASREAGEGRAEHEPVAKPQEESMQILRPSPCPLPEGEGESFAAFNSVRTSNDSAPQLWEVLCRPGKRIRIGDRIIFGNGEMEGVFGDLCEPRDTGLRLLQISSAESIENFLEAHGHVPIPPYLEREDTAADAEEYQTVYAKVPGAVAAPTAGLHFTASMFDRIRARGVEILQITLHVGIGTFLPVRSQNPSEHVLKPERYAISEYTASQLNKAREAGRRIIAVGTTTTRTLEYVIQTHERFVAGTGEADLFILPGYEFKAAGGMLTNFHLPKSTLIMLVSAFAGRPGILSAYRHAVAERYRFYSYGDCMLIL